MTVLAGWFLIAALAAPGNHASEIRSWRAAREARLRAADGWLTVAGLFWLTEGINTAGSAPVNRIVLPSTAPGRLGSFEHHAGKTVFVAERGARVTANGKPVQRLAMRPDTAGSPEVLEAGSLSMFVIQRGKRYGIRLRDTHSKFRREFAGLTWFPVNERYHVSARWVPYDPPRKIPVPNVLGETEMETSPGYAVFRLGGRNCRLEPVLEEGRLFIIFRDLTTGKETYPAGRFLYAEAPRDGRIVLDFNKAYNPPCAFTPYATCPLPPKQNHLPVRIPAGEKTYHH